MHACPICGRPVAPGARSAPFCSERCRLVDLGNWLDERYLVPSTDDAGDLADAADAAREGATAAPAPTQPPGRRPIGH